MSNVMHSLKKKSQFEDLKVGNGFVAALNIFFLIADFAFVNPTMIINITIMFLSYSILQ